MRDNYKSGGSQYWHLGVLVLFVEQFGGTKHSNQLYKEYQDSMVDYVKFEDVRTGEYWHSIDNCI